MYQTFQSCGFIPKRAVRGINLIIPKGECFGLLGVNGAGKTTTFKMLTGDISSTGGTASISGYDIRWVCRMNDVLYNACACCFCVFCTCMCFVFWTLNECSYTFVVSIAHRTQLRQVQQRVGYCPQFDALIDRLTGRELLTMFARLRGVPEKEISRVVQTEIERLDLTKHASKRCGTYRLVYNIIYYFYWSLRLRYSVSSTHREFN